MNFSEDERDCRVDFFKPSGKWYTYNKVTFREEDWGGNADTHTALGNAIRDAGVGLTGMTAICLYPWHKYSHPISLIL